MSHPSHHSFAHLITPGWMPHTKSLSPHIEEPCKKLALISKITIALASMNKMQNYFLIKS